VITLPQQPFYTKEKDTKGNSIVDMDRLASFVASEYAYHSPKLVNTRSIFRVDFYPNDSSKKAFAVFPETELDPGNNIIAHPDRKIFLSEDIYAHVSGVIEDEEYKPDTVAGNLLATPEKDTILLRGDLRLVVDSVTTVTGIPEYEVYDLVARTHISIFQGEQQFRCRPTLLLQGDRLQPLPDELQPLGLRVLFTGVDTQLGKVKLSIERRNEFIIMNAIRKPWINFLWLGTFLLAGGFGIALYRRIDENRKKSEANQ
jgi:cytochrome c-type biogenesis protein CcmF